jgi:thiamine biosynthesis lipoprotein
MACGFEITLPGDSTQLSAAHDALDRVDQLEECLSLFRATSEVTAVNRRAAHGPVRVGPDILELLTRSAAFHAATEGAFDITSTPLSRVWGFLRREGHLPRPEEIETARAAIGMRHIAVDRAASTVRLAHPLVELNFNAIGKGYAIDAAAARLRDRGVRKALLSAGGSSLRGFGGGRQGFIVDVRSPRHRPGPLLRLRVRDGALGTSGAGEQFFEAEGRRYGHVIDPRTGWPCEGVLSASVVADDATTADALATAFLVGGPDLAHRYCAANPRTMALLATEAEPGQPLLFGSHDGVDVLPADPEAARPTEP